LFLKLKLISLASQSNPLVLEVFLWQGQTVLVQLDGVLIHAPHHKVSPTGDLFMESEMDAVDEVGLALAAFEYPILAVYFQKLPYIPDFQQTLKSTNHVRLNNKGGRVVHVVSTK